MNRNEIAKAMRSHHKCYAIMQKMSILRDEADRTKVPVDEEEQSKLLDEYIEVIETIVVPILENIPH